jgi:hypothetical protein
LPPPRPPEEPSMFSKFFGHRFDGHYHTMRNPPSHQLVPERAPRKQIYVWSCCYCGDGPSTIDIVTTCNSCYHNRCAICPVERPNTYVENWAF